MTVSVVRCLCFQVLLQSVAFSGVANIVFALLKSVVPI